MQEQARSPVALIILDGWGHREETEDNAIANGHTPNWDRLWRDAPHTLISGSGLDVGLPEGQFGNSEVGHMSLGSGRVVYQSISRIDQAITDGSFGTNAVYCDAIDKAVTNDAAVHVMGLLSPGGVHSHERQIFAALRLAAERGAKKLYLHGFLDGRDTPPRSAADSLAAAEECFAEIGAGRIATITGRYYAMDRDQRWDRVEGAYRLLTEGVSEHVASSAAEGLQGAYSRDENDEFVLPTRIGDAAPIQNGDSVLFMNFRADRPGSSLAPLSTSNLTASSGGHGRISALSSPRQNMRQISTRPALSHPRPSTTCSASGLQTKASRSFASPKPRSTPM